MGVIMHKIPARAGLIGNPSDGYHGKTIALPIRNFHATVKLWEKPGKIIIPHDENEFDSIEHLSKYTSTKGFYDAGRLIKAAVAVFSGYLSAIGEKPSNKPFQITYQETPYIPLFYPLSQ